MTWKMYFMRSFSGVLLLCLGNALCNAQNCSNQFIAYEQKCTYRTCHSSIEINEPNFGSEFIYSCYAVSCCGQLFTQCKDDGYRGPLARGQKACDPVERLVKRPWQMINFRAGVFGRIIQKLRQTVVLLVMRRFISPVGNLVNSFL